MTSKLFLDSIMNRFNALEVVSAASDCFAMKMGLAPKFPHPLAGILTLKEIAAAAAVKSRPTQSYEADMAVFARGLTTSDFQSLMSDAVAAVSVVGYETQGEHLRFCASTSVKDFKQKQIPVLDSDIDLELLAEAGEVQWNSALTVGGEQPVQLATFGKIIRISREAMINDDLGAIAQVVRQIGAGVSRKEARLVAAALEANGNMSDGNPVFHSDYSNLVEDGLAAGLSKAVGSLRKQLSSSGQRVDLKARHLVVEPDLETTAKSMVRDLGLTDLEVSVLADLPSGRYYVLASEQICPTISVLRLGTAKNPLHAKSSERGHGVDGMAIRITADLGAVILHRQGIVRGAA